MITVNVVAMPSFVLAAAASSRRPSRIRGGFRPRRRPKDPTTPSAAAASSIAQRQGVVLIVHDAAGGATTRTHFEFRTVPEDVKESLVGGAFSNVADKYDVMNDVMSGGVYRLWEGLLCDIAFRFLDHVKAAYGANHAANVTVVDINLDMLKVGMQRAEKFGHMRSLPAASPSKKSTPSTSRPSPDASVDAFTIAFGIRNCTHVDAVVREAYLVESIRRFPPQPAFARMIRDAGFRLRGKGWEDLTFWVRGGAFGVKALNGEEAHPPFVVH
ncbi:hypothetical protein DFJ73DRAFT_805117 [Zopfochytrium polystomum]|nr:hypothetical protein DFJ73DRAFT_805117 [Zopfochytrium polystomum]